MKRGEKKKRTTWERNGAKTRYSHGQERKILTSFPSLSDAIFEKNEKREDLKTKSKRVVAS